MSTMRTVIETFAAPDGTPLAGARYTFRLTQDSWSDDTFHPPADVTDVTGEDGSISVDLWCNAEGFKPTQYEFTLAGYASIMFVLPVGEITVSLRELLAAQEVTEWSTPSVLTAINMGLATESGLRIAGDALIRSDLAADDGTDLIGYQPSGVGGVPVLLTDEFKWRVRPQNFNGQALAAFDNDLAIEKMLTACYDYDLEAHFDPTDYGLTTMQINGASGNTPRTVDGHGARLVQLSSTSDPLLLIEQPQATTRWFTLKNLIIDAAYLAPIGLKIRGGQFMKYEALEIRRCKEDTQVEGLYTAAALTVLGGQGYGVYYSSFNDILVGGNASHANLTDGIRLESESDDPDAQPRRQNAALTLSNVSAAYNKGYGLVQLTGQNTLLGGTFERNGKAGIKIAGGAGSQFFPGYLERNDTGEYLGAPNDQTEDMAAEIADGIDGLKFIPGRVIGTVSAPNAENGSWIYGGNLNAPVLTADGILKANEFRERDGPFVKDALRINVTESIAFGGAPNQLNSISIPYSPTRWGMYMIGDVATGVPNAWGFTRWKVLDGSDVFQRWENRAEALFYPMLGVRHRIDGLVQAASFTPDLHVAECNNLLLSANITINAPINYVDGQDYQIVFKQNATGGWVVSWNAAFVFTRPNTYSTVAGTVTCYTFRRYPANSGSDFNWVQVA